MNRSITTACILAFALMSPTQAQAVEPSLAPTPPMGWNSWNCFKKEIDEKKIRAIADAMVRSGMREAGYVYLVLDDAWMANSRDENGRLQADPEKFPSGMRALRDYAHEKGLRFGLYCRTEGRNMLTSGDPDMHEYVAQTIAAHGLDLYRHDTSEDQWTHWVHTRRQDGFEECVLW